MSVIYLATKMKLSIRYTPMTCSIMMIMMSGTVNQWSANGQFYAVPPIYTTHAGVRLTCNNHDGIKLITYIAITWKYLIIRRSDTHERKTG